MHDSLACNSLHDFRWRSIVAVLDPVQRMQRRLPPMPRDMSELQRLFDELDELSGYQHFLS